MCSVSGPLLVLKCYSAFALYVSSCQRSSQRHIYMVLRLLELPDYPNEAIMLSHEHLAKAPESVLAVAAVGLREDAVVWLSGHNQALTPSRCP